MATLPISVVWFLMDSGEQQLVTNLCQQIAQCLESPTSACSCRTLFAALQNTVRSPAHKYLQDLVWNNPSFFQPILRHGACCRQLQPNKDYSNEASKIDTCDHAPWTDAKLDDHEFQLQSCKDPGSIDKSKVKGDSEDNTEITTPIDESGIHTSLIEPVLMPNVPFDEEFGNTWVMCLANLIAGNTAAVDQMCASFGYDEIRQLLESAPCRVGQKWCAVLHSVLLHKQHVAAFCRAVQVPAIVSRLCSLYCDEGPHSCFARYCLETLLCQQPTVDSLLECWRPLSPLHRVLCLTCLTELLQSGPASKRTARPTAVTAAFLMHIYQLEAGKILSNDEHQLVDCDPQVVRDTCAAVVAAASSSDAITAAVRGSDSLLFITLCFLKALNKATYDKNPESLSGSERWSRQHLLEGDSGAATAGLRCDLIRLIGNLVYHCPANQEQLRQHEGLEEIFYSIRRDDSNPLIQEAVIFTLKCSLCDNLENWEYLTAKLNSGKSDKDCPVMKKLGLVADMYVQVPTDQ